MTMDQLGSEKYKNLTQPDRLNLKVMYIIFMLILITAEQKMNNDGRQPPNRRQPYNQNVRRADQVLIKMVIPLISGFEYHGKHMG